MKPKKPKREIRFVITKKEIELLMEADSHFLGEFSGKTIAKKYEFTYSYEALDMLSRRVNATLLFNQPKNRSPFERLFQKIDRLLKLSDALSKNCQNVKNRF